MVTQHHRKVMNRSRRMQWEVIKPSDSHVVSQKVQRKMKLRTL